MFVLTSNHDIENEDILINVEFNRWLKLSPNLNVYYTSNSKQKKLSNLIKDVNPSVIYINSIFSLKFSIIPLLYFRLLKVKPKIILAPRGMLQDGALRIKSFKKLIFLYFSRTLDLYKEVFFHATDFQEKLDIEKALKIKESYIKVIPNIPADFQEFTAIYKTNGNLKVLFLSRISQKKNLLFLLHCLKRIGYRNNISLNIAGPRDTDYWQECEKVIEQLKHNYPNISINYLGPIKPEEINKVIQDHHVFVLPTFGENFGHAIFESFAAGRPVIISDKTPWRYLNKENVGFDLSLSSVDTWVNAIEEFCKMDQNSFDEKCKAAHQYAENYRRSLNLESQYKALFLS